MYTMPRRVNGQDHKYVLCISRRQSKTVNKWVEPGISFQFVLPELIKYIRGRKKKTETAENQFCRAFIFYSLASIDNDLNRDRIN